ncbi:MAG: DUF2231 domain-containing protein [Acidimicrobiia bacterium]
MLDTIAGIPSHPLFVHAPVVLIPLVGLAVIALAFRPGWRTALGWWPAVAAGVSLIATFLAVGSGNAFDERLDGLVDTERHESLALTTLALVAVFFGATVAQRLLRNSDGWLRLVELAVTLLVVVSAGMAVWWTFLTGEEGARITWSGVVK